MRWNMYYLILICLILAMLAVCVSTGAATSPEQPLKASATGFLTKTVDVDGKTVKYVVYVPATYDPKVPTPTIISLNGAGECGTDGFRQVTVGLGRAVMFNMDRWPYIIIFPQKQKVEEQWEDEDAMFMAILNKTKKELNIDESRLYLTGLSQGGHGTWALGAKHADLFAAIAPVCGYDGARFAKKLAKMPMWIFHGEADDIVPVDHSTKMVEAIKAEGGDCKITTYPGVKHNSWDKAYNEGKLWEWFLEHRK